MKTLFRFTYCVYPLIAMFPLEIGATFSAECLSRLTFILEDLVKTYVVL